MAHSLCGKLELLERSLKIKEKNYGPEHIEVAVTVNILDSIRNRRGCWSAA